MKNILVILLVTVGLCGCSTIPFDNRVPLRVGITPNYPPMVFRQNGELDGLEIDLMRRLGKELDRPITVVLLPWEEQMDALVSDKIDIIMSGMSITDARKVKIAFTDPWMRSGLMAMLRHSQVEEITSVDHVLAFNGNIGVIANTTAGDFVRSNCKNARVIKIASPSDAAIQLKRRAIDLFIHDIPSIAWQVASNESETAALLQPLNKEEIAWGVNRDNTELLAQLNDIIKRWRADGSLDAAILKWIPYYAKIK